MRSKQRCSLKLVVFDFDGVIINSEPLMREALAHSYRQFFEGPVPIDEYLSHMGLPFNHIMDAMGLPRELAEPYMAFSNMHLHRVEMFPGAYDCISRLRSASISTALLTGKDRTRTLAILKNLNLSDMLDMVVASSDLEHPKPHPEGLLRILEGLRSEPTETVMVGDSVNDIECSLAAGVDPIGVSWGTRPELLRRLRAPFKIVDDFDTLDNELRGRYAFQF